MDASPSALAAIERVLDEDGGGGVGAGEGGASDGEGAHPDGMQQVVGRLAQIEGKLEGAVKELRETQTAKERLQEMVAAGLLKFVKRVDARSIKVICAVLARGDMAKAARAAGLKYSTMWDLVAGWRGRGKDYAILADLVRWRKQMRFRGTVPLDETMLESKTPDTDYAGLLGDVLEGLLEMTEEKWEEKCETLADLLRSRVER